MELQREGSAPAAYAAAVLFPLQGFFGLHLNLEEEVDHGDVLLEGVVTIVTLCFVKSCMEAGQQYNLHCVRNVMKFILYWCIN